MSSTVNFLYDQHLDNHATTIRIYNYEENNELVVKAFYQDDFHMSITNQWSTGDSTILKSLVDGAASLITGRGAQTLTALAEAGIDWASKGQKPGSESAGMMDKIKEKIGNASTIANSKIYTADDFYKTFKGSNVTFPLNLQVTLVSDEWISDDDKNTKEDIYDKLNNILGVSLGNYNSTGIGFIGIQNAPNGFKTGAIDLNKGNKIMDGTLKVVYGDPLKAGYVLRNMLISNVHCTFSKTRVKINTNTWRPLYIDVQIMLEPGKKFTKDDIDYSLGLTKRSRKERTNFISKNGRSARGAAAASAKIKKATQEARIARDKEIKRLKAEKDEMTIHELLQEDLGNTYYQSEVDLDGDLLTISSRVYNDASVEDLQALSDTHAGIDLNLYPGITRIKFQSKPQPD